ncbi:hypothetical protein SAMN04489864_105119 [Pedobacter insulae]|uniref:Uncharacterized protein n=1 Tax=Pedobacter insulae TaxID=414048 RepID=A0A1I2XCQ2_9SPHI|nr:hypothetical protein SAMN04489864_105119 [Pedobacter insulae]
MDNLGLSALEGSKHPIIWPIDPFKQSNSIKKSIYFDY